MRQFYANLVFYPTLWWNMLLGRVLRTRNWWDPVKDHVIIGAFPFEADVAVLADLGVKAVVNTCQEYAGPIRAYQQFGIEQLRIPTIDFTHPSLESVERAVQFMEEQIDLGHRVYVHCKAGRARSATVVVCWLIKRYQISASQAQQILLDARRHVNSRIVKRNVVIDFERKYFTAKSAAKSESATRN